MIEKAVYRFAHVYKIDTLLTLGPTSGRVGKAEGDVTQATIYCRVPELGGLFSTLTGRTRRWSQFDAMGRVRHILASYPDVRSSVQTISPLGSGGGRNSELSFNLLGPDLDKLTGYSEKFMEKMRATPGLLQSNCYRLQLKADSGMFHVLDSMES